MEKKTKTRVTGITGFALVSHALVQGPPIGDAGRGVIVCGGDDAEGLDLWQRLFVGSLEKGLRVYYYKRSDHCLGFVHTCLGRRL